MTNIIVAFPKQETARKIKRMLVQNGFHAAAVCATGAQSLQSAEELSAGIVVCGSRFADMGYAELREYLPLEFEMLVLVPSAKSIERVSEQIVFLSMPVKGNELLETLRIMEDKLDGRRKKQKFRPKLRTQEDRDLLDLAKLLLMERNGFSEEEAHRYIQKRSMENGVGRTDTAQMIVSLLQGDIGSW